VKEAATLLGCGDVGPIHGPTDLTAPWCAIHYSRFAQVERVCSTRGALHPHSGGGHSRLPPDMAWVFADCGFDMRRRPRRVISHHFGGQPCS
jgi:hypothetical protein